MHNRKDSNDFSSKIRNKIIESRPDSAMLQPEDVGLATDVDDASLEIFHEELRKQNWTVLVWTNILFNPALLVWSFFDYYLVPDLWKHFLILRIIGVAFNFTVLGVISRPSLRRYSWEGMWLLVFTLCTVVALMLPHSGDNFTRYVFGFVVIIFGTGIIPIWQPRWGVSVLLACVGITAAVLVVSDHPGVQDRDIIGNGFVILTAMTLSFVSTYFKYDLTRRDFVRRMQLSTIARREFQAKESLGRISEDLKGALKKLKEVDRLKGIFFANISHELRTPLTLILAPVDELSRVTNDDYGKQQLRVIRRNAERLLGLINDLLDLSRLDAGGLRLNVAEMDVRSVVAGVYENSSPSASAKGIEFLIDVGKSGGKVWGDAHRLEIVVSNLVSNAMKFTDKGGRIQLTVRDGRKGVRVEVEDNGLGIPQEDLPRVFERFFQVGMGDRRQGGGVGIGLALAKELVELHGGRIEVESSEGKFTRFWFELPFGRDHIRPEVVERRRRLEDRPPEGRRVDDISTVGMDNHVLEEPAADGQGEPTPYLFFGGTRRPRVLIVDDHEEVRDFIRSLMLDDFDLEFACNGREALGKITEGPPDLVVSDVMMPEMDGTELCAVLKTNPSFQNIPVILLTARVGSEATLEAYAHGADDFVAKPFHPRVLLARIRAQLRLRDLGLQLAEREKLAAVGALAAGILHEVRNPVNAILNASRVLAEGAAPPDTERELLEVIGDGAERIQEITVALDAHARPAEAGETLVCDVREGVDATLRLVRHRLDGIEVIREFRTERLAKCASGPLNQVILNLLDNSLRAGARRIFISLNDVGENVQIRVEDDGSGISSHNADRIFDPFFTTMNDGSGTGLGLYLSRKIVTDQGGSLWHEHRPGGGAQFIVEVPSVGEDYS